MYFPAVDDENTTLRNYLEVQLNAVRDAGYGLDEEQLRATPLRSKLSLAGLLKHCAFCMQGALAGAGKLSGEPLVDPEDFYGSFTLDPQTSVDDFRTGYDALVEKYLALVAELELDEVMDVPPMPWYGVTEPRPAALRYLVVHHVEEFARHAGHADLIREQIDGAQAASLNAPVEGRAANAIVTPWQPDTNAEGQ